MLRHLVSVVALACSCSALAAVEISLPAPSLAEIHPDGARLHHRIELPAGVHRVELPDGCASVLTVLGAASWT
ncbi:MAG: hypothetical protein H0W83_17615, partial [Planctomycetes bacterium]|nr:hypothetical protein [Planctomycetota bacterium]